MTATNAKQRYYLDYDHNSQYYVVPDERASEFDDWADNGDIESPPAYAIPVGNNRDMRHVSFTDFRIDTPEEISDAA